MIGYRKHHPRVVAAESCQAFELASMRRWGEPGEVVAPCDEISIDRGGPFREGRSLQTIEFDGFKLSVPTMELLGFLSQLEQAEPVEGFYEIRGWIHIIALTSDQRLIVLAAWRYLESCTRALALTDTMEHEAAVRAVNEDGGVTLTERNTVPVPAGVN